MEQLLSDNFDIDSLGIDFEGTGFGPASADYDFKDQFDGKLFKPYNKRERLGKMCDFAQAATSTWIPPKSII